MATLRDIRRLFEAIAHKDWEGARSLAEDLAVLEAKRGNHGAARILRDSLHSSNGYHQTSSSIVYSGLSRRDNPVRLQEVALPRLLRNELETLILEVQHADALLAKGFRARRKMIFTGPPGCGKSLTAQAIANELSLPHYVVRFDAIIGSYLGQTAGHLRQLFHFAETTACVLLFDEIDALGKRRGNPAEIGELDRIVIALMQELELTIPKGFVIATSNIPRHLDPALWRRFDARLEFPSPSREDLKEFMRKVTQQHGVRLPAAVAQVASKQHSYADTEAIVASYIRQRILSELTVQNGRRS